MAKSANTFQPNALLTRSELNARWIEAHCYVPEGKLVGKPVVVSYEQRLWLQDIYDSPTRMFILSMGRKNAKTATCAFLLLLHLCGPEARPNSSLYSAAQSREQAGILFSLAAKVVRMSPDLSQYIHIRDTAKQLFCPELGTLYRALSADASTSFGLSPAFTVHDELGQVRGPKSDLYDALETAGAAQDAPLSIIISTQATTDGDLLSMLIDDALTGADPLIKCRLYSADIDADPFDEDTIRQSNPHYDIFMNREEVKRQAESARRLPSKESAFRNLILNQRVEAKEPFVTRSVWMDNREQPRPIESWGKIYGGLDLSAVSDLTALVLVSDQGDIHPTFWLPEEGLAEKSRNDRVPYDVWEKQGFLFVTPGRSIEYEFIAEHLRGVFDDFGDRIEALGFDRYNMKFLRPWLVAAGFTEAELEKFVDFGQGFVSMSPAIRDLESKLLQSKMKHGAHPVLTMCFANAVVVKDPAGNRKFTKQKVTGRIDGAVATAIAVGVMPIDVPVEDDYDECLSDAIVVHRS